MSNDISFDYNPLPTLVRFHASNALIKGVRGPIGSGKTVGACMDIVKYACLQEPYKGVRHVKFAMVRNCYDDQTEILTEKRGWQLFKNVDPSKDKVATLQNNKLVYEHPNGISKFPYKGKMIGYEGESVDFLVTPDHKMWVSRRRGRKCIFDDYHMEYAEDVYKRGRNGPVYRVKKDVDWDGGYSEYSEDYFEWLGFWFAEGHAAKYLHEDGYYRYRCVITQINEDGKIYARKIFEKAKIPYTENPRNDGGINFRVSINTYTIDIIEQLLKLGKSYNKRLPFWIKNAPKKHLVAFIHGFEKGDGYQRKEGTRILYTSSKQLADDLQEIALKAGMAANINCADRRGQKVCISGNNGVHNYKEYAVTLLCSRKFNPYLWKQENRKSQYKGWYEKKYDGMVYCAEMPIETVYVRRNKKAFWCMRTYQELLQTTLETWRRWFGDYSQIRSTAPIEARMRTKLKDKSIVDIWLLFLALDRPDDVKKLKSLEVTGSFLNEASEMGRWVLTRCFERRGRYPDFGPPPTWAGVIADTNSCDDDHWWYKASEEENNQGWEFFNQPPALLKFAETIKKPAKVQLEEYFHNNPDYKLKLDKNYRHQKSDYAEKISKRVVKDLQGNLYIANPEAENAENLPLAYDYWLDQVPGKPLDEITVFILNEYGTVTDSKPVYSEYIDSIHCAKHNLKAIPNIGITLGFDFGRTPACTMSQITAKGQKRVFEEFLVEKHGSMGIRTFSRTVVVPHLLDHYLDWLIEGLVESFGDPAGKSREQTDEKTCFMILNECPANYPKGGFPNYNKTRERLRNKSWVKKLKRLAKKGEVSLGDLGIKTRQAHTNSFEARVDAVSKLLISYIDNEPAILISPHLKYLRKGMRGKYCYKRVQISGPDARYKDEPDKNIYSHISEGLQYDCLESSFRASDPDKKNIEKEKEHRKEIGTASCAAWDELKDIKEAIKNDEYDEYLDEMMGNYI